MGCGHLTWSILSIICIALAMDIHNNGSLKTDIAISQVFGLPLGVGLKWGGSMHL